MLLVSGSTRSVSRNAHASQGRLGLLLTPRNRNSVRSLVDTGLPWAIDNGAFSGFDADAFAKLAEKAAGEPRLLWVVCPDVVADAVTTLARFDEWQPRLAELDVPVAFVGQDGQEHHAVPWDRLACLFIGGSTEWKLSHHAERLAREAKDRGKLVHMGRVNSYRRIRHAVAIGCDSIDGSSASMFGDKYIHKYLRWMARTEREPVLF